VICKLAPVDVGVGRLFPGWANSVFFQGGQKDFFQGGQQWRNFILPTPKLREKHFYTNKVMAK